MKKIFLAPVYFFVFLTGMSGLVYQVTWQKYMSRLLGSDSIATAIILASFLGGLSVGYFFCGKFTTKVKNCLKIYGILEGIIGIWCAFFPTIFAFVQSFTRSWSFSQPFLIVFQGLVCSLMLMGIPTFCMGGTIPFLTRGISRDVAEATHIHARVYSINTVGAFVGTLLAGFYLIPHFGLPVTMMGTAFINLATFLFFYFTSLYFKQVQSFDPASETGPHPMAAADAVTPRFPVSILYAVAFISGFYVMTLENVFIRIINLSMGSLSYSFSLIVSVFILCIAIGSYWVSRRVQIGRFVLLVNQMLIALTLGAIYLSLDKWPYWAHVIRIAFQPNAVGFWLYYGTVFFALLLLLVFPISLMGASIPIVFHEIKRDLQRVGKHSGFLFSWNTIGNLTGSLVGGIVLFYFLNNANIYLVATFLAALSACLLAWYVSRRLFVPILLITLAVGVSVIFSPFYQKRHFLYGTFRYTTPFPFSLSGPKIFFKAFLADMKLESYKDGPTATVAVVSSSRLPQFAEKPLSIIVNGKSDSSTIGDIYTLKLSAHLPGLLAQSRKQVLVIGLGTGVTAGELTLYPDIECIDIAEICPFVVKALPFFHDFIYNLESDPRVRIHRGDAFRILGRSKKKWDIVISEPSNPWMTGVDQLYTEEFYRLVKEHLNDNGLMVQWTHSYSASKEMMGMIFNTLQQNFQYNRIFQLNPFDLIILSTNRPITSDNVKMAEATLSNNPRIKSSLDVINLGSMDSLLLRESLTPSGIAEKFSRFGLQTMDNPVLHYLAGRAFFTGEMVPKDFVFSSKSAFYQKEFLLAKKYTEWTAFPATKAEYDMLLTSTIDKVQGLPLPMTSALKLKAYLQDPVTYPLTDKEKEIFRFDLLQLIIHPSLPENAWDEAGQKGRSIRQKLSDLILHMDMTRNWIACYPIDGLKALLKKGIVSGSDAYEKNWCALMLAQFIIAEKGDKQSVKEIFAQLVRDKNDKIHLYKEDLPLLELVVGRMNRF